MISGRFRIFSSSEMSRPALRHFQPPTQCAAGAISPLVKLLKREASHLPVPSIEVRNKWCYAYVRPYAFTEYTINHEMMFFKGYFI